MGSRIRTRGGASTNRGRGYSTERGYVRSDFNSFAALSIDHSQDGGLYDQAGGASSFDKYDDGQYTVVKSKGKRLRMSTGSGHETELCDLSSFSSLPTDDKLCEIMAKLSVNQNKIQVVENKLDTLMSMDSRLSRSETVILSHDDRLKLLEYKSIDNEARNRRNNLLFKGLSEERNEDCFRRIEIFVRDNLGINERLHIDRAHRLGRFSLNKVRPIIVAFRDYGDTDSIMSRAKQLRGSPYGISRDYPPEIVKARQKIWPEYKTFKQQMAPNDRISINFPAKLIVNKETKLDLFPDWNRIMKGSRISVTKQSEQSINSSKTGFPMQRQYAEVNFENVMGQQTGQHDYATQQECVIADDFSDCSSTENMEFHEHSGDQQENISPGDPTNSENYKQYASALLNTPQDVANELLRTPVDGSLTSNLTKNATDDVFNGRQTESIGPTGKSTDNQQMCARSNSTLDNSVNQTPETKITKETGAIPKSGNSKTHTSKTTIQLSPQFSSDSNKNQATQKPVKEPDKQIRPSRIDIVQQNDFKGRTRASRTPSTQRRDTSRTVGPSESSQA